MKIFKILFVFFILSSCDYLEKKGSSNSEEMDGKLIFVGETSELAQKEVQGISKKITGYLKELKGFCGGKAQLQKVKNFADKLQELGNYAQKSYNDNAYSFFNIKVKDGNKEVDLSGYLLEIGSVLKPSKIKYSAIKTSADARTACGHLKDSYRFSYVSHYNLADNVNARDTMTFLFKSIDSSINCLCK